MSRPSIHILPCKIKANGTADVTQYFAVRPLDQIYPESPEAQGGYLHASFRGRGLVGKELHLPTGAAGTCHVLLCHVENETLF